MNKTALRLIFAVLLMFLAFGLAWSQDGSSVEPAKANLIFTPLGFLQFGPMIDLEFNITSGLYGLAHVRLHGMGLLSYLIYDTMPEIYSVAAGTGLRYLFPLPKSPHSPYMGFLAEFGYTPYTGGSGSSTYSGTTTYVTVAFNGGFRWRFDTFLLELGAYAGIAPTLSDEWHYDDTPAVTIQGDKATYFFGMVELGIGFTL